MDHDVSVNGFFYSAVDFARAALGAQHAGDARRVALEAGTALEHLAKACLAQRSPGLLVELRGEANWLSLAYLLGVSGATPRKLRTVGLRDALARVETFVSSKASNEDLRTLVDLRDGAVHAAADTEVEQRLLAAFVRHVDALLVDLDRDRALFWGEQIAVVDTLLLDASDKTRHRVSVKMEASKAKLAKQFADVPKELKRQLMWLRETRSLGPDEDTMQCPVCGSMGLAVGEHYVEWGDVDEVNEGGVRFFGNVTFSAERFGCPVCGLRLDTVEEIEASGADAEWEVDGADPYFYADPPQDEDGDY